MSDCLVVGLLSSVTVGMWPGDMLSQSEFSMYVVAVRLEFQVLAFFFQAEDGIRDLVRSRGLGDVYKRQLFMSLLFFLSDSQASTYIYTLSWSEWVNLILFNQFSIYNHIEFQIHFENINSIFISSYINRRFFELFKYFSMKINNFNL